MHDPHPPIAPKKKTGWSTWSPFGKVMAVFGIAIGSFMLLGFLAMIAGGVWLYLPGSQVDSAHAIASSSRAVGRIHVDVEDPGVAGMLTLVAATIDVMQREQDRQSLPPSLRFIADMQGTQTRGALEMLWPRDVTVAMAPGPELAFGAIVNVRRLGGLVPVGFKAMAVSDELRREEHRGRTVMLFDGVAVTHVGSSIILAANAEGMRALLDRIIDERMERAAPELMALSDRLRRDGDIHGVIAGPPSFLHHVPEDAVVRAGLSADLLSNDEARGLGVVVPAAGSEAVVEAAVRVHVDQALEDMRKEGLTPQAAVKMEAGEVQVSWRVAGLSRWTIRALDEMRASADVEEAATGDGEPEPEPEPE